MTEFPAILRNVTESRSLLVTKMLHSVDRMNRAIMDEDHEGHRREIVWQAELRASLERDCPVAIRLRLGIVSHTPEIKPDVYVVGSGLRQFRCAGPCWIGDCECRIHDGRLSIHSPIPPLHEDCFCYIS